VPKLKKANTTDFEALKGSKYMTSPNMNTTNESTMVPKDRVFTRGATMTGEADKGTLDRPVYGERRDQLDQSIDTTLFKVVENEAE